MEYQTEIDAMGTAVRDQLDQYPPDMRTALLSGLWAPPAVHELRRALRDMGKTSAGCDRWSAKELGFLLDEALEEL
eukprot:3831464-Pyramimonas_sp.AAC.1